MNSEARDSRHPLLFLYGNLFCYISSYPILGFHVTRVVDFEQVEWRLTAWDGYVSTFALASIVLLLSVISDGSSCVNRALPFAAVLTFVGLQLYRIKLALVNVNFDDLGPTSKIYAYSYALSKRRSVAEQPRITKQSGKNQEDQDIDDKFDEEKERRERQVWRRELIDTYRHMREHGNSAFIFVLELTLAGLCYLLLAAYRTESASFQLSLLVILFAIWAVPAVFIHFVGQHLERQFSDYDKN